MRALMFIFRMIFGVTFILSGFFKVIDPVGTGLIVEEYLNIMHLGFLRVMNIPFGILLSIAEFVIGIAMVMGVRMRVISWVALIMSLFFMILTSITAKYDLMAECGCFGEAISLTPWQTVVKNIVLCICIIPIFLYRKRFRIVAPTLAAWSFLGTYAAITLILALYSLLYLPLGDFGDFRVGSNVAEKYDNVTDTRNYSTMFAYTKDGVTELFDLDNLPDTSWTYVSSETIYDGEKRDLLFDMTLTNMDGEIVSDGIIHSNLPIYIAVAHRPDRKSEKYWDRLVKAKEMVAHYGGLMYLAVPAPHEVLDSLRHHYESFPPVLYGDYRTLIAMVRSNGAVMYMQDGMIVKKWNGRRFDMKDVISTMSQDYEEVMAKGTINRRLFYELAVFLMFLIVILFRYICSIIYGKHYKAFYKVEKERRRLRKKLRKERKARKSDPLYAETDNEL